MSNIIPLFSRRIRGKEAASVSPSLQLGAQLSLPFHAPRVLFLLTSVVDISGDTFQHFSTQKAVAAFFDLRFSPRLDFIAPTRAKALSRLREMGVAYYDVFGRAGINSPRLAFEDRFDLLKEVISIVENEFSANAPYIMIFDNHHLSNEYRHAMQQYFEVVPISSAYMQESFSKSLRLEM
jgi:hypothetical protein